MPIIRRSDRSGLGSRFCNPSISKKRMKETRRTTSFRANRCVSIGKAATRIPSACCGIRIGWPCHPKIPALSRTIFTGIRKVEPGCERLITNAGDQAWLQKTSPKKRLKKFDTCSPNWPRFMPGPPSRRNPFHRPVRLPTAELEKKDARLPRSYGGSGNFKVCE
jgi:hypothetical protein